MLGSHGLTAKQVQITDAALRRLIHEYTREAGVRNLERELGAVGRKIARRVASGWGGPGGTSGVLYYHRDRLGSGWRRLLCAPLDRQMSRAEPTIWAAACGLWRSSSGGE